MRLSLCRCLNRLAALAGVSTALLTAPALPQAAPPPPRVSLNGNLPLLSLNDAQSLGPLAPNEPIQLALTLPLRDPQGLQALLTRLYDPNDELYGQFLTSTEFTQRFGPTPQDYQAVAAYAKSQGLTVTTTHPNRLVLDVAGPTRAVETAFGVHLNRYRSVRDGRVFRAPDREPSLPISLANRIQGVIGLDNAELAGTHSQKPRPAGGLLDSYFSLVPGSTGSGMGGTGGGSGPGGDLAPSDIRAAYDVPTTPLNGSGQTLALFEADGYTPSDITFYENYFGLNHVPLQNVLIDGYSGASGINAFEVTLDIQMMVALAPGASKILVYECPGNSTGLVDTYNRIATDNLAKSISTSWYYPSGGSELNAPASMRNSENSSFMQMAAQGQSIFAISGDFGAYANGSSLSVEDPASQPYVTAVGGTTLTTNGAGGGWQSETTWNDSIGAGGGGISLVWGIPSYQSATGIITAASLGSTTMRNVPDVSLNAEGYATYFTDIFNSKAATWYSGYGTSYATPLWAAFSALVNQQRVGLGKSTLGFANPMLYTVGTGFNYNRDFHDIADGSTNKYYPAVKGYDLATGWGTYNGMNLLADLAGIALQRANFCQVGNEDLVFQNTSTEQIALWDLNGTTILTGKTFTSVPEAGYQVVGCGDFNNDGLPDLVFQNQSTGQIAFWLVNQLLVTGGGPLSTTVPPGFNVVGIADFNGDGSPDILFQNISTGQLAVWYMNGTSYVTGSYITKSADPGYQVVGVGDFNLDGHPDILFQNSSTGQLEIWYMNGITYSSTAAISNVPLSGWKARAVGDFNHDGHPDIAFQNTSTGGTVIWFMNNATYVSGGATSGSPPTNYVIVGPR
jgi:kumamolisin